MVRIKAIGLLLHLGQHGPPSVLSEISANSIQISASREWRGEPHPVRGYEPYDAMREGVDLLLSLTRGSAPKSRFAKQINGPPARPPPDPPRPTTSIMTPYQDYSPPVPERNPAGFGIPFAEPTTGSYTPRVSANRQQQSRVGAVISGAATSVTKFFKKPFTKRGDFASFQDVKPPDVSESSYSFVPVVTETAGQSARYGRDLAQSSLMEENAPAQRSSGRAREGPLKPIRKAVVNLTAAKRLLKVTGGRALANAEELRAFQESFSVESIDELVVGLSDQDWKVNVRAILGLELAAERYGLQAVAKAKQNVLSLNGAPQASLRTAAVRFYSAIKDVKPGPPSERSAFSFISEEQAADDDTGGFAFVEEGEGEKVEGEGEKGEVEEKENPQKEVKLGEEEEERLDEEGIEPTGDEAPIVIEPTGAPEADDEKGQDDKE